MSECKNVECKEITKGKNVYCSFKCRNVYVNKYLRDYSKLVETNKNKRKTRISFQKNNYNKKLRYCLTCKEVLNFEQRNNKFCNSSCAAKTTNKLKKGLKHNFSIEGLEGIRKGIEKRRGKKVLLKIEIKISCRFCNEIITTNNYKKQFCNNKCRGNFKSKEVNKNLSEKSLYKKLCQFKFSLNKYPDYFDFNLIKKYGWYKAKNRGNNLSGVSRDHLYSINEGFKNKIPSELISHPANCKLILQRDNSKKHTKCDISLDELKALILNFENIYIKELD